METESDPSGDQEGAGLEDAGTDGAAPEAGEGDQQQDTSAPEEGQQQQPPPRGTRAERREQWKQRNAQRNEAKQQDNAAIAELRRHNEQLTAQLREAMERFGDVMERTAPPRESPLAIKRKELNERYEKCLARLDKDPTAAKDFQDIMIEFGRLGAAEEREEQARQAPAAPSAVSQSLFVEFPWLHPQTGDMEARAMVNGETAKLVRREKRDMRNQQVAYATLRQAAAIVARELGYPVPVNFQQETGNGRQRMAGTGGRSGGPGGPGPDSFTGQEADIEAAATIMYPALDKAQAVAKWKAVVGKRLQQSK